jgi:iron complex transport system substrate-binding protein
MICGRFRGKNEAKRSMSARFLILLPLLMVVIAVALARAAGAEVAVARAGSARIAAAPPRRVLSLNVCTDQLLLLLLPPARIAALTWLSRTEGDPELLAIARTLPINHGSAEEVLAIRPDLVVAGRFTTGTTRALLQRAGIAMIEVDPVSDWEGIRRITRELAARLGEVERGEQLLAAMDADLAALEHERPYPPVRVMGWGGASEDVPVGDTLFNTILEAAGGVNVAATPSRRGYDVEQVLRLAPEVLMRGAAYTDRPALRDVAALHPALRPRYAGRLLAYPEGVYGCGTPSAARWARELASSLRALRVRVTQ